ncbi:MAG: hypothetical protein KC777_22910 [Cyanobacteria bacterium HKST-UBA02]|nr:hypothetical protein [Cyanobacteria bacterium HKST-UBA02]
MNAEKNRFLALLLAPALILGTIFPALATSPVLKPPDYMPFKSKPLMNLHLAFINLDPGAAMKIVPSLAVGAARKKDHLLLARSLMHAGYAFNLDDNLEAALNCFETAHALAPEDTQATCLLVEALRANGEFEKESKLLGVLDDLEQKSATVYSVLAGDAMRRNDLQLAQNLSKLGIEASQPGDSARCQVLMAKIMVRKGIGAPASKAFEEAAVSCENPYIGDLLQADAAFLNEDSDAELQNLEKAGQRLPDDPAWHAKMATHLIGKNQNDQALDHLARALKSKRFSASAILGMAGYLMSDGKLDEATQLVERLKVLQPHSSRVPATEGDIYRTRGRYQEALSCYDESIRRNPCQIKPYADIANILSRSKARDAAIKKMKACVEMMPAYWRPHFMYSSVLERCGKINQAIVEAKRGLALLATPDEDLNQMARYYSARAHALMGTSHYAHKEMGEAVEEAIRFNELKFLPRVPDALKFVSLRPGRLHFSEDHSLSDPQIRAALADMLLESEKLDDCVKEYREAVALAPNDDDLQSYLLNALSRKGDWVEAAKQNLSLSNNLVKKAPGRVANWMNREQEQKTGTP